MTLCTSKFNRLWIKDLQKLINGGVRYTPTVHSAMLNEDHLRAWFHIGKRRSLSLPGLMALS